MGQPNTRHKHLTSRAPASVFIFPHRVPIVAGLHWASDRKPIIELVIYSIVP
jgi:hypothetical protein